MPRVVIGTLSQSLELARELKILLTGVAAADVWENAFRPGGMLLLEILRLVERYDFGVFVFAADDLTRIRRRDKTLGMTALATVRDNVIF